MPYYLTPEEKNQYLGVIAKQTAGGDWCYLLQTRTETEQIRKSARKYPLAFRYSETVTGGNKRGMSRFFTFGQRPSPWHKHLLMETYHVSFITPEEE
jgi:hypothetical protein